LLSLVFDLSRTCSCLAPNPYPLALCFLTKLHIIYLSHQAAVSLVLHTLKMCVIVLHHRLPDSLCDHESFVPAPKLKPSTSQPCARHGMPPRGRPSEEQLDLVVMAHIAHPQAQARDLLTQPVIVDKHMQIFPSDPKIALGLIETVGSCFIDGCSIRVTQATMPNLPITTQYYYRQRNLHTGSAGIGLWKSSL
jgi:hypothetical protein